MTQARPRPVVPRLTADLWAKIFSCLEPNLRQPLSGSIQPIGRALRGRAVPISASSLADFYGYGR